MIEKNVPKNLRKRSRVSRAKDFNRSQFKRKAVQWRKKGLILLKSVSRSFLGNKLFKILFVVCFMFVGLVGLRYFLFSDKFSIANVDVLGNEIFTDDFYQQKLNYLYGQNIFFTRSSKISEDAKRISSYVKNIHIEKTLPDTLLITVEERTPLFVWVNLSGAYLIDDEGIVLEIVSNFNDLQLSSEDLDLLKGYGDLSELMEEEEKAEEGEGGAEGVDSGTESDELEEDITEEDKVQFLKNEQMEVTSRVEKFWNENFLTISKKYRVHPFVYGYDLQAPLVMDTLDSELLNNTKYVLSIDFLDKEVIQYVWESSYRFVICFKEGSKILFSTRREFSDQIDDLEILQEEFKKEGVEFKVIDLSSEALVYEFES